MGMFPKNQYSVLETVIGDLRVSTVLDQGFYCEFGMSPELHSHSYYELLLSVDGILYVELAEGERITVEKGDFFLIPPGIYHGTHPMDEDSKKLALRFRYGCLAEQDEQDSLYAEFHSLMSSFSGAEIFPQENGLSELVNQIREELLGSRMATEEYLHALLTQFYIRLLRIFREKSEKENADCSSAQVREREQRRLWIEEYFQQYFSLPVTEDHMAKQMNLSKRQVSRVLREIYGSSFRQLLIEERLYRASQLLLTTERTAEEIAFAVGYTSLSGFYSAFRQKFGMTAGEYRRQIQKKS